jgi:hypothetical protein
MPSKMLSKGTLTLASLLVFISCKNAKPADSNSIADVIITQQRLECMGLCPVYMIKIYSDGKVLFNGEKNVPKTGESEFEISEEELNSIVNSLNEIGFFKLQDRYTANISDGSTTYISFKDGDNEKKIMDYYGAPPALKEVENNIEQLIFSYLKSN